MPQLHLITGTILLFASLAGCPGGSELTEARAGCTEPAPLLGTKDPRPRQDTS
jgi:hypothetical protein